MSFAAVELPGQRPQQFSSSVPLDSRQSAPQKKSHRRTVIILLAVAVFVLAMIIFSQQAFTPFLSPNTNEQTLIFAAVSALIFVLLVALTFVLLRTLLKLFAERRVGVLGSKFRTKMVLGALILSLTPVIFLFMFAYGLMNRSIDKWFSQPVEEVREDTAGVANLLSNYAAEDARAEATAIAQAPETIHAFASGNFSGVLATFRRHEATLQGGFAFAILDGESQASYHAPDLWPVLKDQLLAPTPGSRPHPVEINGREFMLGSVPVGTHGTILVAMPLPANFSAALNQGERSERRYFELYQQRKAVRRTYMGLLLLITMMVVFATSWFALFLSKFVTRPVAALAEATQEISRGRLEYRVEVPAGDELGTLVQSFNRMAAELESSRKQIEASTRELAEANVALERRRQHIETILESIPTGVLSLDAERRVTHANTALTRILRPQPPGGTVQSLPPGSALGALFPPEVASDLQHQLRKADRMGSTTSQMEMSLGRQKLNVAVTVASLRHEGQRHGYVIVFEDLSDLLKAQKQAAWREVARRVAHEIKNPLTPIALSAERIRRHLERGTPPDDTSLSTIRGCAETIGGAVETLRTLVDEFSALARFPTAQPQPADINGIVEGTLAMFNGRLEHVEIRTSLAPGLPKVMADPEAMKRALANLVDNAAEAMRDSLLREVQISTTLLEAKDAVEIVVADTGHGVTGEVKEKLFLPYFSTKSRGTGLGLAIVSRIVEDHQGTIRVEENAPLGTRFVIELPVAPELAPAESHA